MSHNFCGSGIGALNFGSGSPIKLQADVSWGCHCTVLDLFFSVLIKSIIIVYSSLLDIYMFLYCVMRFWGLGPFFSFNIHLVHGSVFSEPLINTYWLDFPAGAVVKNPPASAGDMGLSPDLGRSHMPQSN